MKEKFRSEKTIAIIMACWMLVGCAGSTALPTLQQLAETSGHPLKLLKTGRSFYLRECGKCHRHIQPSERLPKEWKIILARKQAKVSLTASQFNAMQSYILASCESEEKTIQER